MTAWGDLETRGFVVVRAFLAPERCAALLADFERGAPPTAYPHGFKLIGRAALAAACEQIEPALAELRAHTTLAVDTVNFLTLSHYITTSLVERTSHLHQDFDLDYKLTRNHRDYLNFWIPIAKPDRARSNLCVVPFDALAARCPAGHAALLGSGGHRLVPRGGQTAVYGSYGAVLDDTARDPEQLLDIDIETLIETPELDAGDLLLLRGDVLHRTQDASTPRIAASIRATGSHKRIARATLAPIAANDPAARIHATLDRCFAALARDEVTIGELVTFARGTLSTSSPERG